MDAEKIFRKHIEEKDDIEHTEQVVKLCEEFADKFSNDIDKTLLIDAAWLHDIAKPTAGDNHHIDDFVRPILKKYISGSRLDDIVEIISVHKNGFNPKNNKLESAILRICDKLDRFRKNKKDPEGDCKKSLKKISKKLDEKQFKKLEQLSLEKIEELAKKYPVRP